TNGEMLKVAIANQKGGTGKTTTALILSYLLSRRGYDVLAIDLDPQASFTLALGYDPDEVEKTITDVFSEYVTFYEKRLKKEKPELMIEDVKEQVNFMDARFDFVPSNPRLEAYNLQLGAMVGGERLLYRVLDDVEGYDIVIIDTQPTLSKLVINALVAADRVLAPVELSYLSIGGLTLLISTVADVKELYNRNLSWLGILPVKYEKRSAVVRKNMERLKVLEEHVKIYPPVPKSVALERLLIERISLEDLVKKLRSAREVLSAYENVVKDIEELMRG
ncbi:hypothetical protein DRP04_11420, partial [Archaeoglobales archaeon]